MKRALCILAVLLIACGLYFALSTRTTEVGVDPRVWSSLERRELALEPLPPATHRSPVVNDASTSGVPPPSTPAMSPRAAHEVRVVVLSRDERLPQADVPVQLAWWKAAKGTPAARGVTEASGSVNLRLESGGEPREPFCTVTLGEGERARSFRALPLQSELVVLMDSCARLHGRIVVADALLAKQAWIQIDEPARGMMSCSVMLGRSRVRDDGAFEIEACPSRELAWVDLRVMIASVTVLRRVSWTELTSEEGARIELRLGELTVRVLDESGAPLAGAEVRVAPLGEDAEFPAVGASDARGEYRATLEPGEFEIVAGMQGRACANEKLHFEANPAPPTVELRLPLLTDADRVRGRVVNENGKSIEGALVTISPTTETTEGAMAGFVQLRTDAKGRFEVAIATNRELTAVAFQRELGMSDKLRFRPDGRELELVIRSQGSLEILINPPHGLDGFRSGYVEYVLVDRRLDLVQHDHEFQVPFTLYEVPAGDYNLFLHVAGWSAYAEGSVHVEGKGNDPDDSPRVELPSQPAQFARGNVRAANGGSVAGAVLELDHPTWPPEVEKLWSAKIASDGRFELFLGAETSCPARLSHEGTVVQVQVNAGDGAELVIP